MFAPPAPAFKPGMRVLGPQNEMIGVVQTLTNTPSGYSAVLLVDGVLVTVPTRELRLQDDVVHSASDKAQILRRVDAPR